MLLLLLLSLVCCRRRRRRRRRLLLHCQFRFGVFRFASGGWKRPQGILKFRKNEIEVCIKKTGNLLIFSSGFPVKCVTHASFNSCQQSQIHSAFVDEGMLS